MADTRPTVFADGVTDAQVAHGVARITLAVTGSDGKAQPCATLCVPITQLPAMVNGMGGSMDAENGTISGNTLRWTAKMTAPMPMTLECEAVIDGDALTGTIKAGAFGSMAMTGTRQG